MERRPARDWDWPKPRAPAAQIELPGSFARVGKVLKDLFDRFKGQKYLTFDRWALEISHELNTDKILRERGVTVGAITPTFDTEHRIESLYVSLTENDAKFSVQVELYPK